MKSLWILSRLAVLAVMTLLAACATPKPGEAVIPDGAQVTHRAVLIGESNHDARGTISLYQAGDAGVLVFEPNFRLEGPVGSVITLGRDGYKAKAKVAELVRNAGRQSYLVPPELPIARFNEVWLWHEPSERPIGLGRLTPIT